MKIRLDKLDKLFSEYVRKRAFLWVHSCEYCGRAVTRWLDLQCCHYIGRRVRATRYDPDNAFGGCFTCHNYLDEHSYAKEEFFRKRLGTERLEQLNIRGNLIGVRIDKETVESHLKELIREIDKVGV